MKSSVLGDNFCWNISQNLFGIGMLNLRIFVRIDVQKSRADVNCPIFVN